MKNFRNITSAILQFCNLAILLTSCSNNDFTPKPKGYFRIDLPEKSYQKFNGHCPFTFEFHKSAHVNSDSKQNSEPCWLNIEYPQQKAIIHLSYKKVENDTQLVKYIEDSRAFVYKHTIKASDILEDKIFDDSSKVYGLLYSLEGDAASSMQFYITDSVHHFMRGALYFNVATNVDSLSPVISYIRNDIHRFIGSFEWK